MKAEVDNIERLITGWLDTMDKSGEIKIYPALQKFHVYCLAYDIQQALKETGEGE